MKVVVEADGGSRGNPGVAGYGAVVLDARGYPDERAVLAERAEGIGRATNNVAEYRGLIAGLEASAELGASEVAVRMDSKLVVEQMSGRWKIKNAAMAELAAQARILADGFGSVTYEWIPRAENSHADALANEAMDGGSVGGVGGVSGSGSGVSGSGSGVSVGGGSGSAVSDVAVSDAADTGAADRAGEDRSGAGTASGSGAATEGTSGPGWTGATGEPTRLILLRHGQTAMSIDRRYSGRGDAALTELGQRQAEDAARRIGARGGIDAIVSSPLARAYATATASADALGLGVEVDDDLIETDFGEWEGLTFAEAARAFPDVHRRWLGDPTVAAPGGESFTQVAERVRRAREQLLRRHPGGTVLVVSHVTPIKLLLRDALGVGYSLLYRLHLDLASVSVAEFYPDGGSSVRLVGDTAHLR